MVHDRVHGRVRHNADADDTPAPTMAVDPVCQMRVERALAGATEELDGRLYFFCSAVCKQTFHASPRHYARLAGRTAPADEAGAPEDRHAGRRH
jgi:Cu+-exporting ATPase